ncbi:hypothetical protein IG193_01830 [Infirmifilum lucidum]|uniref:Uncharacterized protein n=1 Tax=Infirmifilum lucidum TaxID=2776706 RepID=A0A7L9FK16_9CREN|nr:hypothetical protein [Infirmifilum lucidum]QOJ79226.1 hypothetical protein IG193_01830 [Infirmifilum lucidum]
MESEIEKFASKVGLRLLNGEEVYRGNDGAVYRVPLEVNGEAFIVHSVQSALVASRPEIVGRKLDSLVTHPARLVAGYLRRSGLADRKVVFMHVLRGSQGYRLDVALREAGFSVESQFVKVVYAGGLGEKHAEAKPHVASAQLTGLSGEEKTLVVADTVATGRTLKEALRFMLDMAVFKGVQFEKVVIYGFISESGARVVGDFLGENGITPLFFALEDFAALASNQYDMPLYGPDIGPRGVDAEKTIAGVSVPEALRAMLGEYFPGMDQPGDWSERQCLLFNGYGYERGKIGEHLERSLKSLEVLHNAVRGASWYEEWLEEVFKKRRKGLKRAMGVDACTPE